MAGFTKLIMTGAALAALAAPGGADAAPGAPSCARTGDANACRRVISIPTTLHGKLESAAGIDDVAITVRTNAGGAVHAYCNGQCRDDWFATDKDGARSLKPSLRGRKVVIDVATEHNNGRIAGPGEDEKLLFVKRIRLQK
jgi:hypothetical protein